MMANNTVANRRREVGTFTRSEIKRTAEGGQAHFAPQTAQDEPILTGFETAFGNDNTVLKL